MLKKLFIALLVVGTALVALSFTTVGERYFEIARSLDTYASLFKEVNTYYVDDVNPNTLMKSGAHAMLSSLDPYTNYISEDEIEDFQTMNTGQYGGIGCLTREIGKRIVVTMVYDGYPAQKNGLKIGDELVKLDSVELSRVTTEEANHLMRGQVGKPVKVTLRRPGRDGVFVMEFKREKIKLTNVPYFGMGTKEVGYVQLTEFTPEAGREVKNAVQKLKEQGAKSIVLDLRGNPGGLLFEAVNICNIFIPKGKVVVTTKGKTEGSNMTYETLDHPLDTDIPVAVLVNRGSASASEIVAGTLQDYDRAVIIGEKSYGKGLVQQGRQLPYKAQVKVTTAKYYTPSGRCIQVLDYSHRRSDGSVGSIPDSIKKEFKTTRGRNVFDGGGIDPDIKVAPKEAAPVVIALIQSGLLFDYASHYALQHPTIAPAREFSLTELEYKDFVTWTKGKSYPYASSVITELDLLREEAKREHYLPELKSILDQIQVRIEQSRKEDLTNFKEDIRRLLEADIASRYYYERGIAESVFRDDEGLKSAIDVLGNLSRYNKILKQP